MLILTPQVNPDKAGLVQYGLLQNETFSDNYVHVHDFVGNVLNNKSETLLLDSL